MLEHLINTLKENGIWEEYKPKFEVLDIPARTLLIKEGTISKKVYFIKSGCIRYYINDENGTEITFQFGFEGQTVSSLIGKEPCVFNLQTIEPSIVYAIDFDDLLKLEQLLPGSRNMLLENVLDRLKCYGELFISRIKNSPLNRYLELIEKEPKIIQRVPQHYIASYLGITSVSLSRIKNKVHK